ncbi:hypothetical protein O6H91_06G030700 [Diphasiastrum complanatum]|uniref:Uncharacterized protein n=1 Tax=Diphasiastrum complanatum TaxID=34168 RepID=A0ACC2DCB3_DIPCM|nr:hypothetical protein O6H91_06G030700 [Diphasiastrum complanatum]
MATQEKQKLPLVERVPLGCHGLIVSKQGLGCMGMSHPLMGGSKDDQQMIELIHYAVDCGITFLDTADVYGPHTNEILVGKAVKGIRDKVQIATKFGVADLSFNVKGDPAYVRSACEASLKRLDVDCIDLYYQHRIDPTVPIEITVGEMKKLVEEGKVKYLGLSEASAADIKRAHAVHPISAVQLEWSLWTRDVEAEIIPTCRELGIGIVSYSPLGRGFFSGKGIVEEFAEDDWRKTRIPRFRPQNLELNKVFYERLQDIGAKKQHTPGQIALAWLHHQGNDVVPIPGTTKIKNFEENVGALAVHLSKEDLQEIEEAVPPEAIAGERSPYMKFTWQNTCSPPLSSWKNSI